MTLKITEANKPDPQFLVNYGVTDALAPFPLHSLVTTMTATINNNTISQNVQDTLPVLLRLLDEEEMTKYDCMTPTALDYLADYSVSYTHLRAHETGRNLVCRLLLEKKILFSY